MLINSVTLQNFKSYEQAQILFQPGVNAIIGPNGAGKSSILEAIGFVLFNCRGSGYERRLREGATRGQVLISLVSSLDEREYDVERVFSENATVRYRVCDPQLSQILAEGVEDVQAWIARHLKVEPGADLATLFENTIGVPQGTFTAPFLLTAAQRKGVFDPLLQVDEYQRASDKLLVTGRLLTRRVTDLQVEVARLEGLLAEWPRRQAEEQTITREINSLQERKGTADRQVLALGNQLETLDRAESQVRQCENAQQNARMLLATIQERLYSAQKLSDEATQAQKQCVATQGDHEEFILREAELRVLNHRRTERDALLQQRNRWSTDAARQTVRQQQLESDLTATQEAAAKLFELEPLVVKQQSLEQELRQVESQCEALIYAQRQQLSATKELAEAESRERQISERLALAAQLEVEISATQLAIQQAQIALTGIAESRARNAADMTRLQTHTQVLADATTARCPVCDLELTPQHRIELIERNRRDLVSLEGKVQRLDENNRHETKTLQALTATLKKQQAQLREFPSADDYTQTQAITAQRRENLRAAQDDVKALAQAPERRSAVQSIILSLGDPLRSYQLYEAQAKRKSAIQAELQVVLQQQTRINTEIVQNQSALEQYADLDTTMRDIQEVLDELRLSHQRFLANEKTAAEYRPRLQQVERLINEVAKAQADVHRLEESLVAAQAEYDATTHQRIRGKWLAAQNELAATQAQLGLMVERKEAVQQALQILQNNQQVLTQKQNELVKFSCAQETLDLIRSWLKEAGPQVTRQLVARISREASNIYSDIMDDHKGWLSWSTDYEVELEIKGARRAFRQLSGGEQMTAALALRLALLRLTSAIDIAFFDEPTAHLDPERRENLAEKITQVKGFSQIFVISHDDTFERTAQSYIRIIKDEHGSHWEGRQ
ncbi:MAG: AAA family ATPase [Anaerolineae bacterium]